MHIHIIRDIRCFQLRKKIGDIEEPDVLTKEKMDREYNIWKIITIIVTIVALGIYIIPMLF